MTLIHVGDNYGTVGRCDAKCYEATGPECDCICGGMNHGKGLGRATENTREHIEEILAKHPEGAAWMDESLKQLDLGFSQETPQSHGIQPKRGRQRQSSSKVSSWRASRARPRKPTEKARRIAGQTICVWQERNA